MKSRFITLLTLSTLTPLIVSCMSPDKPIKNNAIDLVTTTKNQPATPHTLPITHFPASLPKDCNDGAAKLYDECADQVSILKDAISDARTENKKVLIVYGGEWCIWCHVLDNYFKGNFRTFDYEWRDDYGNIQAWDMRERISPTDIEDAQALNEYVAKNFVVAHIENVYANGDEAVELTGFDPDNIYYYPFIVALDSNGKYASNMVSTSAIKGFEVRESGGEEFRGYDRRILLTQLKKLKADASVKADNQ